MLEIAKLTQMTLSFYLFPYFENKITFLFFAVYELRGLINNIATAIIFFYVRRFFNSHLSLHRFCHR